MEHAQVYDVKVDRDTAAWDLAVVADGWVVVECFRLL